ncbi:ParB/RepB/Spo0J family partition protein [Calothrix sp. PCC 6303]|uniref:ParB/RepB/Spo0J family partition protein n=1 Tax=Calothrix sp. PCC 6303 TaxID=1170562 RepID=UPI00130DF946|nr:ParB/RepB/Spo0J family partition protein [Calothrix sp. PCC 6303]
MSKKDIAYNAKLKHTKPLDLMFGGEDSDFSEQSSVPTTSDFSEQISGNKTSNTIDREQIKLDPNQPRRYFDPKKLEKLAQSIKELGILEPLLVRPLNDGYYELIAGERRFKAAGIAGLSEVPCIVKEMDDETVKQVQLIENLQREDLNAYEETIGILELLALRLKMTQDEVISLLNRIEKANRKKADKVIRHDSKEQTDNVIHHDSKEQADNVIRHDNDESEDDVIRHNDESEDKKADNVTPSKRKKQANNVIRLEEIEIVNKVFASIGRLSAESFRANRLPLLNLPGDIQQALASGTIEYTKARAIARVKSEPERLQLLDKAINQNLSLTQIKEIILGLESSEQKEIPPEKAASQRVANIGKRLKEAKVWDDVKKRRKLEKLLGDIEKLLDEQAC